MTFSRLLSALWAVAGPADPGVAAPPASQEAPEKYLSVVTALPISEATPRADPIAAASVIFPAQSAHAFDDLADLLVEVPGVTVNRSGGIGDFATLSLRGSNPDEVRFYLDGVPLSLASGGSIDISTLPLGDVERVEVYRGMTPNGFAESALGGIVSITTRAPSERRLTLRGGAGSFGTMFGDATAADVAGPLHVYAGLHAITGADGFRFHDDNGTAANPTDDHEAFRQNNHLAQLDGVGRLALDLPGRRQLSAGLVGFARDHGLPGMGITQTTSAHFETLRGLGYLSYDSRDDLGAGGRLHAQLFASATRDRFIDPDAEIGAIPARTDDTTLSAGATATASRPFTPWLRGATMAEARRETFQPVNRLEAIPVGVPAERLVGVAGAEAGLWWRRIDLDIVPSARLEALRDVVTGRDSVFQRQRPASAPISHLLPAARLGLARPLSRSVVAKANLGRYGRAPSFLELYGDTGPLLGNPTLRPEIGWNGDLGVEYHARGARAALGGRSTVFGGRVDDLIDWVPISYSQARVDNIGRARIWGVEQDLTFAWGRHWLLSGQATYLDARDESGVLAHRGRQLPLRPQVQAFARPRVRRLALGRWLEAGAYLEGDLSAGAFFDSANLVPVGRRVLLGAGVELGAPRAGLRLAVSAKNLTDVHALGLVQYPLPGRSIFLSLNWSNETRKE
jgi:outer membrane cobalamin receptor